MLDSHVFVEVVEILLSPITSVGSPSLLAGLNPGIHSGEIRSILLRWLVFVDEKWRRVPRLAVLNDAVPIHMSLLGKDEDHRMTVVGQVRATMSGSGTDVRFISSVEGCNGSIGSLLVIVRGLVVEKGDLETALIRSFLQEGEVVIGERSILTVPIHDES